MLFRRRNQPKLFERLRVLVWPRRNWLRSGKYFIKRILRPVGFSLYHRGRGRRRGVYLFHPFSRVSTSSLPGRSHSASAAICWPPAIGTGIGNPITFPFIWGATYSTGCFLTGRQMVHGHLQNLRHDLLHESFSSIWPTIKVMAIGAVTVGLLFALIFYFITQHAAIRLPASPEGPFWRRKAF